MKFALFSRTDNPNIQDIITIIESKGLSYELNPQQIDDTYSVAVTIGGDGTLLNTVRQIVNSTRSLASLPILGINSGRLGFLTKIQIPQWEESIDRLLKVQYNIDERKLLEINGIGFNEKHFALNEFTLQRNGFSIIEIELKIDNVEVARFFADGIIVATPTGSTAYSMSVGGAILSPDNESFIIAPVATHNLSLRPIVISNNSSVEITARSRNENGVVMTSDNLEGHVAKELKFTIKQADKSLKLISFDNKCSPQFYQTLRDKLNWGVDVRTLD